MSSASYALERRRATERNRHDDAVALAELVEAPRPVSACDAVPAVECDARPDCRGCPAYIPPTWGRRA